MLVTLIAFALILVFAIAGNELDASVSELAYRLGYVESSGALRRFFGTKPSLAELRIWFVIQFVVFGGWLLIFGKYGVQLACVTTAAIGGKHWMSSRRAKRLLENKGRDPLEPRSAWQKFIGL